MCACVCESVCEKEHPRSLCGSAYVCSVCLKFIASPVANPFCSVLSVLSVLCSSPSSPAKAKRANGRRHPAKCEDAAAPGTTTVAPLYTTKASKRPQTSSKVQGCGGTWYHYRRTPLHNQSEQTAADIQQSASLWQHPSPLPPRPSTQPKASKQAQTSE